MGRPARRAAALLPLGAVVLWACGGPDAVPPPAITTGSPMRGATTIERVGCGACHFIPGIEDAEGGVGPPLEGFAERKLIAGVLANNEGNLVRWLLDPDAVKSETAMPDVGLTEQQARDVAAYLYSLDR